MSRRWTKGVHWDVFDCQFGTDGGMQIQGCDDKYRDDHLAVQHVIAAAQRGSKVAIDALWEVLDEDGLVNRVLWQMADPRIKSVSYPEGFFEAWGHLSDVPGNN